MGPYFLDENARYEAGVAILRSTQRFLPIFLFEEALLTSCEMALSEKVCQEKGPSIHYCSWMAKEAVVRVVNAP